MVKAIVPAEGIDTLIFQVEQGIRPQNLTILSLPSISINIDELESNMFGTDDTLDRAFATLQYDAQWFGNSINNNYINNLPNPGFYAMIPKFLKCQRIYNPTPLATLQKMTIQLNRPNGSLVSSTLDTLDISGIFSCAVPPTGTSISNYFTTAKIDSNGNSLYYFIQTKTYFSINNFYRGDTIQIKGINTSLISSNDTAKSDFKNYFENSVSLTIMDVANKYIGDSIIYGGSYNLQNYANYLIVQARYTDPTLGDIFEPSTYTIKVNPFGGSSTTGIALEDAIKDVTFTGARLINLTKQTQLTFRVITRDMDSTTRIRANNA
jgi:hypothetical protein